MARPFFSRAAHCTRWAYPVRIAKLSSKYPRYQPSLLRPRGTGALFDFAAAAARRETAGLKCSSLGRRGGKLPLAGVPPETEPTES
jgi:hypothetical protein